VADGKSSITVEAEVRDSNGKLAPDGTRVVFSSDLGNFKETVVSTQGGIAHATLVAGSIAGVAKVTASAISLAATSTVDLQFVTDRDLLSSAKEYIQVTGTSGVHYSFDYKMAETEGPNHGAYARYREIEVHADSIQVNIPTYEVRALKGSLRIGKKEIPFGQLYFKLKDRTGYATTTFPKSQVTVEPDGRVLKFVPNGTRDAYGIAEITAGGAKEPSQIIAPNVFDFFDLSDGTTLIASKRLTAYPSKQVQFEKADVVVGGSHVMKVPYYQVSLTGQQQLFSESIFNVNNNQLAVNYPYYLGLKPGLSSLLRVHTGNSEGRSLTANRGVFLDYELAWDKGDQMQGGLTLGGLGRNDWGVRASQYWHPDDSTSVNAQLELPAHSSLYGNLSGSKQLKGYEISANAAATRSLVGTPFTSEQYNVVVEKDPMKLGKLPMRLYWGATAFQNTSRQVLLEDPNQSLPTSLEDSQSAIGLRLRGQMDQVSLGRSTNLSASFAVSKLEGHNTLAGLTYTASLSMNHSISSSASVNLGYDYVEDGFNSSLLGRHQLSLQANYSRGNGYLNLYALKSIDADRFAYQFDTSYRFTKTVRLGYSLTAQRYFGDSYYDAFFVFGYKIGYKEVGLTFSPTTRRIGFQILGASFN